jgi:hypothetical protein
LSSIDVAIRADSPINNTVVLAELADDRLPAGSYTATDDAGNANPAQVSALANGSSLVGVYVPELAKGGELRLRLETADDTPGRGIDLYEQPENGRIVVNYSGFLQTIYHYGAETFKPSFYPLTAPCGRLGGFDDPQTVYPKSITDDSPLDHIWHRSLWYAAGEVFIGDSEKHVDFYLENGGEGRVVHEAFSDVFSGPVFGGFRQSLTWRTPEGLDVISDERRFIMYRLKGTSRVFDIEAAFTAIDEKVTFGQTNENALPLIRVADVIDEWDGGTLTLADGTVGGKDAFAKRSPWADCTGPLVEKPGGEPWHWGIAMLDHPENRGHPNAWFARSYGPLGTNLPFFDGPLTLQPGETWTLRTRIVIHEGDPFSAGLPNRFDEYANPATIELT